jgi:hypothetical protein
MTATQFYGGGGNLTGVGVDGIVSTANATAITIDSNENVGIGTTVPGYLLTVEKQSGTGNEIAMFQGENSGNLVFRNADANVFIMYTGNSDALAFGTNGNNEKLRILPTGGITFNGDTAQANALDDYEEGSWTPILRDLGGNTCTLSNVYGYYTKIGNLATMHFYIGVSNKGSITGNYMLIGGLPFSHATNHRGTGVIDYFANLDSSWSGLSVDVTSSNYGWICAVSSSGSGSTSYLPPSAFGGNEVLKGTLIFES